MDLEDVERITAGAVGEPGHREFYVQVRAAGAVISVLVEKEQVQLLAASVLELLSQVEEETGPGADEEEMRLEEPIEPLWRAGRLSIGYREDEDTIVVELEELLSEDEEDVREPDKLHLSATREQMLALARQGASVCSRGRPTCALCGNPLDPEGHVCPATNGHKELGRD